MTEILNTPDDVKPNSILDVEGLKCPLPLLLTKKKLGKLSPGDILQVTGLRTKFISDFRGWCERSGHIFFGENELHGKTMFYVKNG